MLSFDNFLTLSIEEQNKVLNDYELIKEMVKQNINERRYAHSLSVAEVSKELAKCHGVDENKAYLAGLLHDCCKFPDSDTSGVLEAYLKKYDPEKLNGIYPAYHSWVAPYYLKEKLNFNDEEILNAIYNHTICNSDDKLSKILYIADKREPLRGIKTEEIEIAKKDLDLAYRMISEDVYKYVKEKDGRVIKNSN